MNKSAKNSDVSDRGGRVVAGFDIGGTKTLALIARITDEHTSGERVEILGSLTRPRPVGAEQTVQQILEMSSELSLKAKQAPTALGVGIAGVISRDRKVLISPNIPELIDFELGDLLDTELDIAVVVENDATAAAVAEQKIGAAQGYDHVLYCALGTGIGTSLIINGEIYRGAFGLAGESGHMVVRADGEKHVTGVAGPWEMYASGSGLGELARRFALNGELSSLGKSVKNDEAIRDLKGEDITKAVLEGNEQAHRVLDEFVQHISLGLTNLIYVLDPELIVIGGGLAALGKDLEERLSDQVYKDTLGAQHRPKVLLKVSQLSNQAGAIGAALLAAETE